MSKDLSYFFVGNLVGIVTASKAASNLEALLPDGVAEAPLLSDHGPVHIPTAYVLLNGGMVDFGRVAVAGVEVNEDKHNQHKQDTPVDSDDDLREQHGTVQIGTTDSVRFSLRLERKHRSNNE